MISVLLEARANVNAQDIRGMSPLMLAVASETQDIEVVKRLLRAGADVNTRSTSGETALGWAKKFGSRPVISLLQKAGAKEVYRISRLQRLREIQRATPHEQWSAVWHCSIVPTPSCSSKAGVPAATTRTSRRSR
jgi:ankyrin repeat protein